MCMGVWTNSQHLDTMKRFYTLFIALCMLFGITDSAMAQSPVQKTRYVYLWDVTGSIKPPKGQALSASEGLYGRMYGYLHDDISKKADGTEIVVIPFNDDVVDVYEFYIKNGAVKAKGRVEFDDLAQQGISLIEEHLGKYNESKKQNDKSLGGYTDIAKSLDWVRKNYVSNGYNTIFILLTDGGQEYVDGEPKAKGDNARCCLQRAIADFDKAMCKASTFNMLFYVMTVNDDYSPRKSEMTIQKTEFISATESSAKLVFCPLTASIAAKKGVISSRDEQFYINISVGAGLPLPKGMKLNVCCDGTIQQTLALQGGSVKVNCKDKFKLQGGEDCCVTLSIEATPKQIVEKEGSSYYIYWLETESLNLKVTNNFKPIVTVRIK